MASGKTGGLDVGVGLDGTVVGAAMGWAANKAPASGKGLSRIRTASDRMVGPYKKKLEALRRSWTEAVVVSSKLEVVVIKSTRGE